MTFTQTLLEFHSNCGRARCAWSSRFGERSGAMLHLGLEIKC